MIPCFTDGLCDCKHNRHGRCLGRMTSPVKKIDLDYLAQTMKMAGGCFNPIHQNEQWGNDPLLYRRPVWLQTRQARTLFGAYDKPSEKIDIDHLAQTMKIAGGCFNPIHQNEQWGNDPLLYRRPVWLQTRQAWTLFGAYDKPSGKNRSSSKSEVLNQLIMLVNVHIR